MTKVLPFNPGHLTVMEILPGEGITQLPNWQEHLAAVAEAGFAFSLVEDGRVVLCGGIIHGLPGVANCWLLPTAYINAYSHHAARAVARVLEDLMETHQLHRLESGCQDTKLLSRWMEFLGFTREGIQRQAGINRTDLVMWGKVKE